LTLEQYLDSGIGIDQDNQQVRMLSGCPELDAPWDPDGGPISTPPVERRHLEMAKRNIEERFIAAAPLEQITELVWFLRRLYKWPVHQLFFPRRNVNPDRPKCNSVSASTRKRLEELNRYDTELYDWVRTRFRRQIAPLQPHFSREVKMFCTLNHFAQAITQISLIHIAAKRLRDQLQ
jgi:Galactose-3-O-sulfotransferase